MNQKKKFFIPVFVFFLASLFFYQFSCSKKDVNSVFGESQQSPLKDSSAAGMAFEIQKNFRDIYELYKDRVVYISTEQTVKLQQNPFYNDPFFREFFGMPNMPKGPQTQKRTGLGTGFILSEDGYICTNHHVVAGVDKVTVKINDKSFQAAVVGSDEKTDVALIKISSKEKLKPVFIGNSDEVKVGDWAIAIGNPFGLDKTFTVGVVSATGRKDVDMMGGSQSHIQTDASINPGNSGGPLINIRGEVVGINRMIYSNSGGSLGIGFAIPINTAKSILEQLKIHKKIKRGYIGVQIVPLTEEYANELGLKTTEGALIGGILDNSPAMKAGLKIGDVILSINDTSIKNYSDVIDIVNKTAIGKSLKATVWREKAKINLFITVAERP
jgi:serine protease Do